MGNYETRSSIQRSVPYSGPNSTEPRSPRDAYRVTTGQLDGALRELNATGLGFALLVDSDGRATVVECAEPVPFRVAS